MKPATSMPPALLLGGSENALSVARQLAARGITVHALNAPTESVRRSRACRFIELPDADAAHPRAWERFLLGPASDSLRGAVLLCCADEAIEILIRHHAVLAEKFIVEEGDPLTRMRLLDKAATYDLARRAGMDTPGFWHPRNEEDLARVRAEVRYPAILKPVVSYEFKRIYGRKFLRAPNEETLLSLFRDVRGHGLDVVVMEFIPGPDNRLCSYYTYIDAEGTPLFHFTKRVIRRSPVNMGGGCYHVTDWIPEAKELGLRFFRAAGLRGLGNIEFKLDEQDGRLKIMECNARFTAANVLVEKSGIELGTLVYNQLTGGQFFPPVCYRTGIRLCNPWKDLEAFIELRRRGELTLGAWMASLFHRQTFPLFSWRDPLPSLLAQWAAVRELVRRGTRRLLGRLATAEPAVARVVAPEPVQEDRVVPPPPRASASAP